MNRIKQLREENNWTQAKLSEKMNCAMSSIAMYENGCRKPSLEVIIKLAELFNCSIDYLLGKSEIKNYQNKKTDFEKIQINLYKKDYEDITDEQKRQIEEFAKFVLKDNKKIK